MSWRPGGMWSTSRYRDYLSETDEIIVPRSGSADLALPRPRIDPRDLPGDPELRRDAFLNAACVAYVILTFFGLLMLGISAL